MQSVISRLQSLTLSQRLLIFAGLYTIVAANSFPDTYLKVFGTFPVFRFILFTGLIFCAGLCATALFSRPPSAFAFIRQRFAERGEGAAVIIATLVLASAAFTTLKFEYTRLIPFFADAPLASIDEALHFGDPWQWLRPLMPAALDYPLFLLYSGLWFVEVIVGVAIAAFLTDRGLRERYLATFTIGVILLSSVVRTLMNSAGPIFYDRVHGGDRFVDLMETLKASPSGTDLLAITDYLYQSFATDTTVLGTGISAMPSLHVALAFLNALFFAKLGRTGAILGWSYFAIIQFGSIYFGWHYAVDGYVSLLVIWALWRRFTPAAESAGDRA